ncbi:MAG: hypothetical protein MZV63_23955 [Marinilabiliales bacterium]|nr:hypothetical protein [Marinilabiliales bacterium]
MKIAIRVFTVWTMWSGPTASAVVRRVADRRPCPAAPRSPRRGRRSCPRRSPPGARPASSARRQPTPAGTVMTGGTIGSCGRWASTSARPPGQAAAHRPCEREQAARIGHVASSNRPR